MRLQLHDIVSFDDKAYGKVVKQCETGLHTVYWAHRGTCFVVYDEAPMIRVEENGLEEFQRQEKERILEAFFPEG